MDITRKPRPINSKGDKLVVPGSGDSPTGKIGDKLSEDMPFYEEITELERKEDELRGELMELRQQYKEKYQYGLFGKETKEMKKKNKFNFAEHTRATAKSRRRWMPSRRRSCPDRLLCAAHCVP